MTFLAETSCTARDTRIRILVLDAVRVSSFPEPRAGLDPLRSSVFAISPLRSGRSTTDFRGQTSVAGAGPLHRFTGGGASLPDGERACQGTYDYPRTADSRTRPCVPEMAENGLSQSDSDWLALICEGIRSAAPYSRLGVAIPPRRRELYQAGISNLRLLQSRWGMVISCAALVRKIPASNGGR